MNQYAYYVTNDLCGDWHQLPPVRPREIIASRMIKRLATGNPKARVITHPHLHPHFDGKEEVLLRAQIARISADTIICIKGQLKKEEEEDSPIEENEEFICPAVSELLKNEAWTHILPHILRNGRCTYLTPYENMEEDEDNPGAITKAKEEQEADPVRAVLRDLASDGLAWSVKQAGDTALYKNPLNPTDQPRSNAVTCVRSMTWPGAICVARGSHVVNLYVGYGMAAGEPDYFPPAPPDVQDEPEDLDEQPEPQGSEEPDDGEQQPPE